MHIDQIPNKPLFNVNETFVQHWAPNTPDKSRYVILTSMYMSSFIVSLTPDLAESRSRCMSESCHQVILL